MFLPAGLSGGGRGSSSSSPGNELQGRIGTVRNASLQSLIDVIGIEDHQIRIKGSRDLLVLGIQNAQS